MPQDKLNYFQSPILSQMKRQIETEEKELNYASKFYLEKTILVLFMY